MKPTPSPFDQLPMPLAKHAIPLDEVGVNNVAWSSDHAFEVLQHLRVMGYGVLGGDVYEYQHGGLSLTYDNWSCDQNPGEPTSEYVRRSVATATDYIRTHASYRPTNCCYAMVLEPAGRD
ncbi:MAG TPA: Imm40 family immunity protein [Longimicrobium sp.]|nr:Imm40 family immunity protein [Longimicrobium sp.]